MKLQPVNRNIKLQMRQSAVREMVAWQCNVEEGVHSQANARPMNVADVLLVGMARALPMALGTQVR